MLANMSLTSLLVFICAALCANAQGDACSGKPLVITDGSGRSGHIYSPGYLEGNRYPTGQDCRWLIHSRKGYYVRLKFEDFDLDEAKGCSGDSLGIVQIDLETRRQGMLAKLCGTRKPNDLVSQTSTVSIVFRSDYVDSRRGFHISYQFTALQSLCKSNEFQCANRKCIIKSNRCNEKDDCGDASDEQGCRSARSFLGVTQLNKQCGNPAIKPKLDGEKLRVVGGTPAVEGSWPWQVSLQIKTVEPSGHFCGGALIDPNYVVTAAHCIDGVRQKELLRLVFGGYHLFKPTEYEQVRYVDRYMVYPDHDDKSFSRSMSLRMNLKHDIALLKLSHPVNITDHVSPICLPTSQSVFPPGTKCYSTGWGQTRGTGNSLVLKQVPLVISDGRHCNISGVQDSRICTHISQKANTVCAGDSGGPLVCQIGERWYLSGLTSHGSHGSIISPICGVKDTGVAFVRISDKSGWIKKAKDVLSD